MDRPGPEAWSPRSTATVTSRALLGSRGDGVRAALGVVCGLLVWGSLAVLGLAALLTASPQAYLVVKVVGAGYLVLLGVRALRGAGEDQPTEPAAGRARPFATGLATNLLNPKIAVFYAALLPTLAPPGSGAWGLGALVLVHAGLTVVWLTGYAHLLDRARDVLQRPRVRRTLDRVTGLVLVGFAIRLATTHP